MKVNQIVGEHKKGYKARKYLQKGPEPRKLAQKKSVEGPVGPGDLKEFDSTMSNGKIVANDGKTITVAMPDGTQIQKPIASAMGQNQQGNPVFNVMSKQAPGAPGQPPQTPQQQYAVGKEVPVNTGDPTEEAPMEEGPEVPYYVQPGPQPMAKTGGRGNTPIVASKLWTAITPEIQAKAEAQGFRKVMLQHNNKQFPGLEGGDKNLGSKIIVSPSDFQSLSTPTSSIRPATPTQPSDEQPGMLRRAVRSVGNYLNKMDQDRDEQLGINRGNPAQYDEAASPMKETAELNAIKKLSGL